VNRIVAIRNFAGIVAFDLGVGALWFVIDATLLWRSHPYKPLEMRMFMWAWNAASVAAIYWDWNRAALTHAKSALAT
jgi:hypothetical protein